MATNLVSSAIVHNVLTKDNYANWSTCMKTYLLGQDLWDVVETRHELAHNDDAYKTWLRQNNMALHAIQISCGLEILDRLRDITSAKEAWDFLANVHKQPSQEVNDPGSSSRDTGRSSHDPGQFDTSSMATNLVWSAMVPEVLRNDNYENWSIILKDYLQGQDLWDVITEPKPKEYRAEFKTWRKRNFMALHAIKISCGTEIFSEIKTITSAKEAWDFLEEMLMPPQPQEVHQPVSSTEVPGPQIDYSLDPLWKAVWMDKWDAVESFLKQHKDAVSVRRFDGRTILHEAVYGGQVKMVEKLLGIMPKEALEIQDNQGETALYLAAANGFTQMARWMAEKNEKLVSIETKLGDIPVVRASTDGHGDTVRYLYTMTPLGELTPDKGDTGATRGATLLSLCIANKLFDVALDLLHKCPRLAFTLDVFETSPVFILSRMPSAFRSGCPLGFWKQWIYSCIRVQPTSGFNYVLINIPESHQGQTVRGSIQGYFAVLGRLLHGLLSYLLKLTGIKHIYDQKLNHDQAVELLGHISKQIPRLSRGEMKEVEKALIHAAKHGIVEIVVQMTKIHTDYLWITDTENSRNIFHLAVVFRQEKIFSLICGMNESRTNLKTDRDRFRNNMLHLAGMLAPSPRLDGISGAALQMQRELQWFKEVESSMPPMAKEMQNLDGQTPSELFTEHHRKLVEEGQKWMKETATSCTVVAALLVTIMFAAAFTVPGGNELAGFPVFLEEKLFKLFIACDAISFLSSTISILIFLGILTSRYGEEYFLKSLPTKMIIGLTSLFISISTMTIAFFAALFLMQHKLSFRAFIPVILFASVPITLFVKLQFPLLFEMINSTYGLSIFNRPNKSIHHNKTVFLRYTKHIVKHVMKSFLLRLTTTCRVARS